MSGITQFCDYAQNETRGMQIKAQQQRLKTKLQQILSLISLLYFCELLTPLLKIPHVRSKLKQKCYLIKALNEPMLRIKDILRLNKIAKEKISVNTFGDSKTKRTCLDKVDLILRN